MKSSPIPTRPAPVASADSGADAQRHGRRRVVVGAGVAAGAALAAAALPGRHEPQAQVGEGAQERAAGEGYRLTDHIRRYYETTRS